MQLLKSTRRRLLRVLITSTGFLLLFGFIALDSLSEQGTTVPPEQATAPPEQATAPPEQATAPPEQAVTDQNMLTLGSRLDFMATAYCKGSITATGTRVGRNITGIAAADPDLLPLGSIVKIATDLSGYNGVYMVLDTGPAVQNRLIDIYMWSCFEALDFGRRPIELRILRFGWDPGNTEPSLIDAAFFEREAGNDDEPKEELD
jgi:3D (Asp-Asp-Asp) domain-containing protein